MLVIFTWQSNCINIMHLKSIGSSIQSQHFKVYKAKKHIQKHIMVSDIVVAIHLLGFYSNVCFKHM